MDHATCGAAWWRGTVVDLNMNPCLDPLFETEKAKNPWRIWVLKKAKSAQNVQNSKMPKTHDEIEFWKSRMPKTHYEIEFWRPGPPEIGRGPRRFPGGILEAFKTLRIPKTVVVPYRECMKALLDCHVQADRAQNENQNANIHGDRITTEIVEFKNPSRAGMFADPVSPKIAKNQIDNKE